MSDDAKGMTVEQAAAEITRLEASLAEAILARTQQEREQHPLIAGADTLSDLAMHVPDRDPTWLVNNQPHIRRLVAAACKASAELTRLTARVAELEASLAESRAQVAATHMQNADEEAALISRFHREMKRAESAERERDEARRENERLRERLGIAIEDIASWGAYADDYFKEKHDLAGCLAEHRAALAAQEGGNAEHKPKDGADHG